MDTVRALLDKHYVRYDESTATALGEGAELPRSSGSASIVGWPRPCAQRDQTGPEPDRANHAGSLIVRERPSKRL